MREPKDVERAAKVPVRKTSPTKERKPVSEEVGVSELVREMVRWRRLVR